MTERDPILGWFDQSYPAPDTSPADLSRYEQLFGRKLPDDLYQHGSLDGHRPPDIPLLPTAEKLVESEPHSFRLAVESSQASGDATPLLQLFTSTLHLRYLEQERVAFFVHLDPNPRRPPSVLAKRPGQLLFTNVVCLELPAFLYVLDLYQQGRDPEREDELATRLQFAEGRFNAVYPFNTMTSVLQRGEEGAPFPEHECRALADQQRALWLVELLVHGRLISAGIDASAIDADQDAVTTDPNFSTSLPNALFWLWRSFFLREEKNLERVLRALVVSPSQLLRDAATLARALDAGEKSLGAMIDDIEVVRDRAARALGRARPG